MAGQIVSSMPAAAVMPLLTRAAGLLRWLQGELVLPLDAAETADRCPRPTGPRTGQVAGGDPTRDPYSPDAP
jgi:hypothetical protein